MYLKIVRQKKFNTNEKECKNLEKYRMPNKWPRKGSEFMQGLAAKLICSQLAKLTVKQEFKKEVKVVYDVAFRQP